MIPDLDVQLLPAGHLHGQAATRAGVSGCPACGTALLRRLATLELGTATGLGSLTLNQSNFVSVHRGLSVLFWYGVSCVSCKHERGGMGAELTSSLACRGELHAPGLPQREALHVQARPSCSQAVQYSRGCVAGQGMQRPPTPPLALFSLSSTNGSEVMTGRSAGGRSSQLCTRTVTDCTRRWGPQ